LSKSEFRQVTKLAFCCFGRVVRSELRSWMSWLMATINPKAALDGFSIAATLDRLGSVFRALLGEKVAGAAASKACVRIEASKKKPRPQFLAGQGRVSQLGQLKTV
jgi:hypothetical protein